MTTVVEATELSVKAAIHLEYDGRDAGAIAALLAAARKIDDWDRVLDNYFEQLEVEPDSKAKPPAQDNATLGTYLKYCESLGLTPSSRGSLVAAPAPKVENELERFKREQAEKREKRQA